MDVVGQWPRTAASNSVADAASESGARVSDGSPSNERRSSIESRIATNMQMRSA